jgi:hypothetical protein
MVKQKDPIGKYRVFFVEYIAVGYFCNNTLPAMLPNSSPER